MKKDREDVRALRAYIRELESEWFPVKETYPEVLLRIGAESSVSATNRIPSPIEMDFIRGSSWTLISCTSSMR